MGSIQFIACRHGVRSTTSTSRKPRMPKLWMRKQFLNERTARRTTRVRSRMTVRMIDVTTNITDSRSITLLYHKQGRLLIICSEPSSSSIWKMPERWVAPIHITNSDSSRIVLHDIVITVSLLICYNEHVFFIVTNLDKPFKTSNIIRIETLLGKFSVIWMCIHWDWGLSHLVGCCLKSSGVVSRK